MRILVIEDDRELRGALKTHLRAECFAVDTAADGEEGSFLARSQPYDLIILDSILPKKNGAEVCKDLRLSGNHTPLLILSIKSTADDKATLLNLGADDYLAKPFSYNELKSRVHALLRRPHILMPPLLKVDDLTLDTLEQRVRRGKKEIYLTRKEFALAEYLLRNRGTVVSRGMLMEHVWNSETDPFSNTIEAHILNLRKKIDKDNAKKLIHTVPGRGYKMESQGKTIFT
jgi:two-component system, OmpR family, response regulator